MQQADQCVCDHPGFDADCDLNLACSLSCSNILSSTMALRQVYRGKVRGGIFQGFGRCTISAWHWVGTHIPAIDKSTTQLGDRQTQVPVMPFLMATDPKIVKVSLHRQRGRADINGFSSRQPSFAGSGPGGPSASLRSHLRVRSEWTSYPF